MTLFIRYNRKLKDRARELRNNATESEKVFWDFLRKDFPQHHFMRQKPLDQFIADFYCNKLKLIIEIDGEIHETQKERDSERDNIFLMKYKINTLRFTNEDVKNNIESIKLELEKYIESHRTIPPLSERGG